MIDSTFHNIFTSAVNTNFLTNLQKRVNPTEVKLPFFKNKSLKNDCSGEVKISWIMSTI